MPRKILLVDDSGTVFLNVYYADMTKEVSEEQNRKELLDNLSWGAGLYSFNDGQMSLIYQNKSYWEPVGLYKEDFCDPTPMSAIHPDDIPVIMQKLAAAIEHSEDVMCDIRLRHLKLGYRPVRLVARVIQTTEGFQIFATFVPKEQLSVE